MAADTYKKENELDKCARSVLIHNADKLVSAMEFEDNLGINYSLEDKVTKTLHKMCKSMISFMEVYTVGKGTQEMGPTSVCVVLGSARQKSAVFRFLAAHMRAQTSFGKAAGAVAMRDMFPKEMVNDVRGLLKKGLELKKREKIASYKVVARGPGLIPVQRSGKKVKVVSWRGGRSTSRRSQARS